MKHILVVDDDIEMNGLLSDFLRRQGYQVNTSTSAAGALGYLNALPPGKSPDLIISDVQMGAASGIDLARQVSLKDSGLPIILFSVFEEHEKEALKSGAKRFLRKPFPLADLSRMVADLLKAKRSG